MVFGKYAKKLTIFSLIMAVLVSSAISANALAVKTKSSVSETSGVTVNSTVTKTDGDTVTSGILATGIYDQNGIMQKVKFNPLDLSGVAPVTVAPVFAVSELANGYEKGYQIESWVMDSLANANVLSRGTTLTHADGMAKFFKTFDLSNYTTGQSITAPNSNFTNLDNSTVSIQADGDEKYVKLSGGNCQARFVMNANSESLSGDYTKIVLDETVRMTNPNLGVVPVVGNTAWTYAWDSTAPAACLFNNIFGTQSTVVIAGGIIYGITRDADKKYADVQLLAAFPANTWVRVSLVFNVVDNTADVYIDGVKKTTTPLALSTAAITASGGTYSVPRQYINNLIFNNGSASFVESKRHYTYALTENATDLLDYATLSGYTNEDTGAEVTIPAVEF